MKDNKKTAQSHPGRDPERRAGGKAGRTGAFLLCFFTGLLYERDRNIWGSVIIHFALGFMPRCFGVLQIIEGS